MRCKTLSFCSLFSLQQSSSSGIGHGVKQFFRVGNHTLNVRNNSAAILVTHVLTRSVTEEKTQILISTRTELTTSALLLADHSGDEYNVCVCVCVVIPFILDVRLNFSV